MFAFHIYSLQIFFSPFTKPTRNQYTTFLCHLLVYVHGVGIMGWKANFGCHQFHFFHGKLSSLLLEICISLKGANL